MSTGTGEDPIALRSKRSFPQSSQTSPEAGLATWASSSDLAGFSLLSLGLPGFGVRALVLMQLKLEIHRNSL